MLKNLDVEIGTTCVGEPFLAKDCLLDIIEHGNNKKVHITTNATLITDSDIDFLKRYRDKIEMVISIDSMFKEEYERIRLGAKFDVVYNNLIKLHHSNLCNSVNFVIQPINEDTWINSYRKLKDNVGIKNISLIMDAHFKQPTINYFMNSNKWLMNNET